MKATKWNREAVGAEYPMLAGNEYGRVGNPNLRREVELDNKAVKLGNCGFPRGSAGLGMLGDEDDIVFAVVDEDLLGRPPTWTEKSVQTSEGDRCHTLEDVVGVLEGGYWWFLGSFEGEGTIGAQLIEKSEAAGLDFEVVFIFKTVVSKSGAGLMQFTTKRTLTIAKIGDFNLSDWARQRRLEAFFEMESEMAAANASE